jgi:hypothetical protein
VYTPGGFEQSFADVTAMLQDGKDQSNVGLMLSERYGLTRRQLPSHWPRISGLSANQPALLRSTLAGSLDQE